MNLNLLKSRDSDSGFTDRRDSRRIPGKASIGRDRDDAVPPYCRVCRWCRPVATTLVDARHSTAPSNSAPLSSPPRHQHPPLAASAALSSFDAPLSPPPAPATPPPPPPSAPSTPMRRRDAPQPGCTVQMRSPSPCLPRWSLSLTLPSTGHSRHRQAKSRHISCSKETGGARTSLRNGRLKGRTEHTQHRQPSYTWSTREPSGPSTSRRSVTRQLAATAMAGAGAGVAMAVAAARLTARAAVAAATPHYCRQESRGTRDHTHKLLAML